MSFIRSVATPALSKNKILMLFQAGLVCDRSVFYVSGQFKHLISLYGVNSSFHHLALGYCTRTTYDSLLNMFIISNIFY